MKKSFAPLILLILSIACSYGQGIKYEKTLGAALALSAKNSKPVFVLITMPPPANLGRTINFANGFDQQDVVDFYNKKFNCYTVLREDTVGAKLVKEFHLTTFPAYLFMDAKGQILFKAGAPALMARNYIDVANRALTTASSGKTLSYYEQLDKGGNITGDQLKEYITLREDLEMYDNAKLADEYVNFLMVRSFDDYNTVLFLYKAGPFAFGRTYGLLVNANKKMSDSVFKREPATVRADINNRMIVNTRNEAIKTKNPTMASYAAQIASSSWGKNYREASKASMVNMMTYYRGINDTLRYFQQAVSYYDNYFMNISADSAKKMQQKILEDSFTRSTAKYDDIMANTPGNMANVTRTLVGVHVTPGTQENLDVANKLNGGAYDFYTLGTHNTAYLLKALVWCRRAIELQSNNPGYYDTMAHIMYRLNFYEEAVLNQNKAIELATNESKTEQDHLKDELAKMRARQL